MNSKQPIDPTIPSIEYLGIIASENQTGGRPRMIHRWRTTLPDLPPFLFEGFLEDFPPKHQEWLQHLQKQYPERFSTANLDGGKLFSDKYLQERLAHIEEIRQKALSGSLFE